MNVLITGSAGFVGKYTVDEFRGAGHRVIPMDLVATGDPDEIVTDFSKISAEELKSLLAGVDLVVHLAGMITFANDYSIPIFDVNTIATTRLINVCQELAVKTIFASTISVHGIRVEQVSQQSDLNPDTPYSLSKWMAEQSIREIADDYAILRIGGIYGLNGPQHLGINRSIQQALESYIVPTIAGPGNAKRNYIYVKDLAKWIVYIAEQQISGVHYIAGQEQLSIRDMVGLICQVLLNGVTAGEKPGEEANDQICEISTDHPTQLSFALALEEIRCDYLTAVNTGG